MLRGDTETARDPARPALRRQQAGCIGSRSWVGWLSCWLACLATLLAHPASPRLAQEACRQAAAAGVPVWFEPVSVPKSVRATGLLSLLSYVSPNERELAALAAAATLAAHSGKVFPGGRMSTTTREVSSRRPPYARTIDCAREAQARREGLVAGQEVARIPGSGARGWSELLPASTCTPAATVTAGLFLPGCTSIPTAAATSLPPHLDESLGADIQRPGAQHGAHPPHLQGRNIVVTTEAECEQ